MLFVESPGDSLRDRTPDVAAQSDDACIKMDPSFSVAERRVLNRVAHQGIGIEFNQ